MSNISIRCEGIGKQYRIGERERYKALRDTLSHAISAPFRKISSVFKGAKSAPIDANGHSTFWALKDVSFEIKHGEVVGIIGRNGAGKSTLLKILSRITKPTTGSAEIRGRVGSLLEVGTGFHPELTGRENIFLNGTILGMKKREIEYRFDEIVAFAEIEKFLDTPVKRYSSGMYVRLAFAVAAHLEPEILVVDEVLAVGDASFQKKCLGKMSNAAKEGRTIIFVSHNMTAVQSLCSRAIWLAEGKLLQQGDVQPVVRGYIQAGASVCMEQIWSTIENAPGNENVKLHAVRVKPYGDFTPNQLTVSVPFEIEISYWNLKPATYLNLSIVVHSQDGTCVFSSPSVTEPSWHGRPFPTGLFVSRCDVPGNLLNNGLYRVSVLVVQDCATLLFNYPDVVAFEVHDSGENRGEWYGEWIGAVRPQLKWQTNLINRL